MRTERRLRLAGIAGSLATFIAIAGVAAQSSAPGRTLDRIRAAGRFRVGYRADAQPFSYRVDTGGAAGYSIALCQRVADSVKGELGLPALDVVFVPVTLDERFAALNDGRIDLLCGADTVTLARRRDVAFSVPIFPGGIGALMRADASARLRDVVAGHGQPFHPTWRAAATQVLEAHSFTAVAGTTSDQWMADRMRELQIIAPTASVTSYDAGIQRVLDRQSDVLFGERAILLDAARRSRSANDLVVADRLFTYEPLALALAKGDDEFRLVVDRALSRIYRSGEIGAIYSRTFGEPDENALTFFRWNALSE